MTLTEFARTLGKSVGWVQDQINAGMPAGEGGQGKRRTINFAAAVEWLIGQAKAER